MEEDIEKALNNLWNSLDDEFFNLTYSQEQMKEDIRLILNRYNYLDSKAENLINKNKELEEQIEEYKLNVKENEHEAQENARLFRKEQAKKNEYKKMVELMAFDIAENKRDEDICRVVKDPEKEDCYAYIYDDNACIDCVIEFYKKKAKGE